MSDTPSTSPYASPRAVDDDTAPVAKTDLPVPVLRRAIATILASAVLFAVVGGLLGLAIGTWLPDYYRAVFPHAAQQGNFNPVPVGIGLGVTQGFAGGAVIGLLVVAAVAWSHRRRVMTP